MYYIHTRKGLPQPPLRPAVLLAGRSSTDERAYPPRPQAMEGSPEGRVPLAPSAQDRPPRRRSKRQSPALTSINPATSKKAPNTFRLCEWYSVLSYILRIDFVSEDTAGANAVQPFS